MIYFDNAATSFPKPKSVVRAVRDFAAMPMGNPGRSGHAMSLAADRIVFEAREEIASLIGLTKPENVVFTAGCTAALNTALIGTVKALENKRGRVLCAATVLEHNSVLRPLFRLEKEGRITLCILPVQTDGSLDLSRLPRTPDLIAVTARSNVTGRAPDPASFLFLKERGCVVIVDAAQSLGHESASYFARGADIVCAPAHKGLMGIMGAGILALSDTCPVLPEAVFSGGSGSATFDTDMPKNLPERLEAGTLPLPAIVALKEGAAFCRQVGTDAIDAHERALKKILIEGIGAIPHLVLYDTAPAGPLLFNHRSIPAARFAEMMEREGVLARAGFHCAPLAHRALGTEETGGVRLSPGFFNTKQEVHSTLAVLSRLAK